MRKNKIETEFLDDVYRKGSPFYLPVVARWSDTYLEPELTKIETQINARKAELTVLERQIGGAKGRTQDLEASIKSLTDQKRKQEKDLQSMPDIDAAIKEKREFLDREIKEYREKLDVIDSNPISDDNLRKQFAIHGRPTYPDDVPALFKSQKDAWIWLKNYYAALIKEG
ncbi:MAG: hypothetical protein ACYCT2_06580 [Thermoplasmataceae archaeon]